ncbi:hypothetical protein PUNSTDRAFT_113700 [Punctularia strigosozonata HHB-11173 SS5]|uniref:uncharacterized protein n=1 Tax=Punctularia strigosozonata (strain HHB-11173) TaxID=741275 RepID=UPI000441772B|nr:uncharacterized protein PUNSTDRAFT_113700 [Punctularia strigosozonata HHB-11173 SS5]EIN09278.1 hypothetical protein PUNSTDRAFT_113700 [Punctularia strigosozonata HHB-11173 SS5]
MLHRHAILYAALCMTQVTGVIFKPILEHRGICDRGVYMVNPPRQVSTSGTRVDVSDEGSDGDHDIHDNSRTDAESNLRVDPTIVHFGGRAGECLPLASSSAYTSYSEKIQELNGDAEHCPWAPFKTRIDWEIAKWAKLRGPSSTAFTELLVREALGLSYKSSKELNTIIDTRIPGRPKFQHSEVAIGEGVYDLYSRDVIACIRDLFGDEEFAPLLVFTPEQHYTNADKSERLYHDMHTGEWWWKTQEAVEEKTPGATIVPIIISSDKTQLTLFRNKSAYPVYLTIGNLPKSIRRKPSRRGQILLAYLPATRLEQMSNISARRRALANLFHGCLQYILAPLENAGKNGIDMASGDGVHRRCHPIFACFVGDYPEQMLVVCCKHGRCPSCGIPRDRLGDAVLGPPRDRDKVLDALDLAEEGGAPFIQACEDAGIKPVYNPFWQHLPYVNIFQSIVPDVLHQLLQGVLKHLIAWLKKAYGSDEIDARCRRMPASHGMRLFTKGISSLSRISGSEHREICKILLGLIVDLQLPSRLQPTRLVRAVRSILDFIYLAQYHCHSDSTLATLDKALQTFHENKAIFVDLGIRTQFNIPKLHFASHYSSLIMDFGTTDNTNTESTERLHIDFTKDAYRSTNKKDTYPQMTRWIERKEKVLHHDLFIHWKIMHYSGQSQQTVTQPPHIKLTKEPSKKSVHFDILETQYGAKDFLYHLSYFVAITNDPTLSAQNASRAAYTTFIPFTSVPVFHRIKLSHQDPHHYCPSPNLQDNLQVDTTRHDTALLRVKEDSGPGVSDFRVAQLRVVFQVPKKWWSATFLPHISPPEYLAYVEWFTPFRRPHPVHGMYQVARSVEQGVRQAEVVPLDCIEQSVHLIPKFGPKTSRQWTSNNVLDTATAFYVNCFKSSYVYKTVF